MDRCCGTVIQCTYSSSLMLGAITGQTASAANIKFVKAPLTGVGKTCPASTFDATYFLSEPSVVFLTA